MNSDHIKSISDNGNLYVYIPSYQSVFLYLHLLNISERHVTAIARTQNIKELLIYLNVPYIDFAFEGNANFKSINQLLYQKRMILDWLNNIVDNSQLVIGYNSFDLPGFYLSSLWSYKKGLVFIKDLDPKRVLATFFSGNRITKKIVSFILQKLLIRYCWGVQNLCIFNALPLTLGIDKKFLNYYGIKPLPNVTDSFMAERISVCHKYAQTTDAKIIYVADHSSLILPYINKNHFEKLILSIQDRVVFKGHPRESIKDYIIADNWIPEFIPAEFFYPKVKIVVSVASAALYQAGYYGTICAVSLLNILDWHDLTAKERIEDVLTKGDTNRTILYPKTMEEFISLLEKN